MNEILKIALIYVGGFIGIIWLLGLVLRLEDIFHGKPVTHPFSIQDVIITNIIPVRRRVLEYMKLEFLFLLSVPCAFFIALSRPFLMLLTLIRFMVEKIGILKIKK